MHGSMSTDPVIDSFLNGSSLGYDGLHDAPEEESLLVMKLGGRCAGRDGYEGEVGNHTRSVNVQVLLRLLDGETEVRDQIKGLIGLPCTHSWGRVAVLGSVWTHTARSGLCG